MGEGRRLAWLLLLGGFFVFAIGLLLWQATNQRSAGVAAMAVAVVVVFLGVLGLARGPRPPPA